MQILALEAGGPDIIAHILPAVIVIDLDYSRIHIKNPF